MQMIRFGDHVGVRYNVKKHSDPFEIYNVVKDPKQTTDLATERLDLQKKMHEEVIRLRRPDAKARRPYDNELVPALASVTSEPGVSYSTFTDTTPWLVKLDDLAAGESKHAPSLEEITATADESILVTGFLEVPADGSYSFKLATDGLALLRIHNATVIDAGYQTPKDKISESIKLKAGKHPFRLYRKDSGKAFKLQMKAPQKEGFSTIPASILSH